jgi:hypothetical protein
MEADPVSETLCFQLKENGVLNKNRMIDNGQKHNICTPFSGLHLKKLNIFDSKSQLCLRKTDTWAFSLPFKKKLK